LIRKIVALPRLSELVLTTNGSQLERLAHPLRKGGVRRINISLDSLIPERFRALTRTGDLEKVLRGIDAAIDAGFERIKLNTVILKGHNHDEILALTRFAMAKGINLSFIEEMPFGTIGEHDRAETFYPADRIREELATELALVPTTETTGGPARYYRIAGSETRVGFIAPRSHNFCNACNRVRVTADGRLLPCLGAPQSVDLRAVLRSHPGNAEQLKGAIAEAMGIKPEGCDLSPGSKPIEFRHLVETGG
jgi:cyclic pyranopterin phosphate synthase